MQDVDYIQACRQYE